MGIQPGKGGFQSKIMESDGGESSLNKALVFHHMPSLWGITSWESIRTKTGNLRKLDD